jgi:hypothetical protein
MTYHPNTVTSGTADIVAMRNVFTRATRLLAVPTSDRHQQFIEDIRSLLPSYNWRIDDIFLDVPLPANHQQFI